jgi:heptaprenyl diphosphate synthase
MKRDTVKRLALASLLAAAALIIWTVEAQIPSLTPIPGIKLGLSNIVTLFALYCVGPVFATAVLVVRIVLGSLLTGQVMALVYSLFGGLPAFGLSMLVYRRFPVNRMWVVSILSAIVHNTGQLTAAILITGTPSLITYYPILVVSAIVTGAFTGLAAQFLLTRLRSAGIIKPYDKRQ